MRTNKIIDATEDDVEKAKETAVMLISSSSASSALDLFYTDDLSEIETGIKQMNEFSNKTWILSATLLYTLIYNKSLYTQSGLDWAEYSKQSRERLGIDQRDISEQLSAARFFIQHHAALERAGWNPNGSNRKLARAELALSLTNDIDAVIRHIVDDTWEEFKDWYQSFKKTKALPSDELTRTDIRIGKDGFFIGDKEAVRISEDIPESDRELLTESITKIFDAIQKGYEPAVIEVYDKKEAAILSRLRDKYRQGK